MPICSYIVYPAPGTQPSLHEKLKNMEECEVERATNRELLLLLTETEDMEHQKDLEERIRAIDEIHGFAQTFGEVCPSEGEVRDV